VVDYICDRTMDGIPSEPILDSPAQTIP